jgi:hypothetical protein
VCRPGGRVVIADMVVPDPRVRATFDAVHRDLDPSHVGALVEEEIAALLEAHVGAVTRSQTAKPLRLPIESILTEAANRDAVNAALLGELAGGPATGFEPIIEDEQIVVAFRIGAVEATRPTAE